MENAAAQPPGTNDLLSGILSELRRQSAKDSDLWEIGEVADYLRLKKKSIYNSILKSESFPKPIILPSDGRRWVAKEVKAWALNQR